MTVTTTSYVYDPVFAAEAHIDSELDRWERIRRDSCCGDCLWCSIPPVKWYGNKLGNIAFCTNPEVMDWTRWSDSVTAYDCGFFEPKVGW